MANYHENVAVKLLETEVEPLDGDGDHNGEENHQGTVTFLEKEDGEQGYSDVPYFGDIDDDFDVEDECHELVWFDDYVELYEPKQHVDVDKPSTQIHVHDDQNAVEQQGQSV